MPETPLKARRRQRGLSAIEVAVRSGIEYARYNRLENWIVPRPDEMERIERVLAEGPRPPQSRMETACRSATGV